MPINKSVTPGVKRLTGNLKSFWAANSPKSCVADVIQPEDRGQGQAFRGRTQGRRRCAEDRRYLECAPSRWSSAVVLPDYRCGHCGGALLVVILLPACGQFGSVDLRTLDRHPGASISSLIPSVSCRWCSPNAPFARLEMLTAERP